ncbi:esterase FE4-like [Amyelois transitella]|uniref:esterase FE4-like n=1 Tax=Amyelois transitella TaxID=680683 RepID=UPI00067AAAD9|nr:esterase FE4-like [Amyelois transitella]
MLTVLAANYSDFREVTIESGRVRGYKDYKYDIYAFYGIPYATTPIGIHKFKAPLPAPQWTNVFEAFDRHIICPQPKINEEQRETHEIVQDDCLIANVYVPNTNKKDLPVLVDIHGGSYQSGFGNMITLKHFADTKKVIVVNFNYRLGVHGFLCLGTKDIPGNAGLKDMVALLRWVKNNIAAFGGNPDEVTVSEYSVASSAIDMLLLSPTVKGLIKRAIPESGPNLSIYSLQLDPIIIAKNNAKLFKNFNTNDILELEHFFKTTPLSVLTRNDLMAQRDATMQFTPCVERNLGEEAFLLQSPFDISNEGKFPIIPILYGFTNMEKIYKLDNYEYWKTKFNEHFTEFLPMDIKFDSDNQKDTIIRAIKEFYFGITPGGYFNNSEQSFINYFTDVYFLYGTLRSVRLQVVAGNHHVYLYEYSFVDDDNPDQSDINTHVQGQGAYLYEAKYSYADVPEIPHNKTDSEKSKRVKKLLKEIWINFITKGSPVPHGSSLPVWPPVNEEGTPYMSIGDTLELRAAEQRRWHRMNFWHKIYDGYYHHPTPPPVHASKDEL